MAIPLNILEAKLKLARSLHPELEEAMQRRALLMQHVIDKGNAPPGLQHDYTHRHKRTEWRCRVRVNGADVERHALLWWRHGPKGHRDTALDAILLRGNAMPLHFDSHFWSRWGKRSELMGIMITNMMGFFRQHPQPHVRAVKRFYPAQPDYAAALPQGLILGRRNGKRLVSCDTFKDHDMLNAEERQLWKILARKAGTQTTGGGSLAS